VPLHEPETAISTVVSAFVRDHYDAAFESVQTKVHPSYVVTMQEDPFTPAERMMIENGAFSRVRETRAMASDWTRKPFSKVVEEATGRRVVGFFSQICQSPPQAVQVFLLDGEASGAA
jgi:uncharacterized protein YbcI